MGGTGAGVVGTQREARVFFTLGKMLLPAATNEVVSMSVRKCSPAKFVSKQAKCEQSGNSSAFYYFIPLADSCKEMEL